VRPRRLRPKPDRSHDPAHREATLPWTGPLDLRAGSCNHCLVGLTKSISRPLLWLLVIVVVAVPWVAVVRQIRNARPAPVSAIQPTAVIWADRVFTSRSALDLWLRSRGASYVGWARAHRGASRVFEPGGAAVASAHGGRPSAVFKPPAATSTNTSAVRTTRTTGHSVVRKSPEVKASRGGTISPAQQIGEIALLLLSGIAVAVGLAPPAQLRRLAPVLTPLEVRIAAVAAGVTIAVVVATIGFIG
jgi:hypothetical protein